MSWWNSERDPVRKALKNARQLRPGDTVQVGDVVKVVGFARAWAEWRIDQGDTVEVVGRVHEVMRDTARPESELTADYRHAPEEELVGLEIEVGGLEVVELEGSWILVSLRRA